MPSESENRPKIQTALIAGCGYVGHRVAQSWTAEGIETFACTRDAAKAEKLSTQGIRPLILDLSSPENWPELPAVDVLLWSVGFDRSAGADRTKVWIDGLRELLSRVQFRTEHGRVIYTSSTGVYGDSGGDEVDEETVACPDSEGGKACLAAEQIVHDSFFDLFHGHAHAVEAIFEAEPGVESKDPVVFFNGLDHGHALTNSAAHRFFTPNVLTSLGSLDGHQRVPMWRSGDMDDIDVLASEHFTEILVALDTVLLGFGIVHALGQMIFIDIAQG